ncbi:MAG: LytTR family DNA-binding domain-containing protein [Flavobacteriaceae bacterium]|nr:LytTR family DNA-binding domain-containing protein [Flavobacteriaceae bacterium]
MIQVLIVDDEPLARGVLQTFVDKIPGWKVVASCIDAESAYDALLQHTADVIFLDIEMPNITGLEFLQSLPKVPLIVFTTAYSQYATKAFDLNVVDYLLKPIAYGRFYQAVEKVNKFLENQEKKVEDSQMVTESFFVKTDGKLRKIKFDDILYIKAEQEYSFIYTFQNKFLVSMHLKRLEGILPAKKFIRIHRSYMIPIEKVASLYGNTIQLESGEQLPLGASYKKNLLQCLDIRS